MILKKYRDDPQCLKLAMIEALIDSKGYLNHSDISQVFGNHVKDSARIVRKYKDLFPNSLTRSGNHVIPLAAYRRRILKKSTNAWEYLSMLKLLHGVD